MQPDDRKTAKAAAKKAGDEAEVLAKIAEMPAPFDAIGKRLHEIIMDAAPALTPRVRYGMPWYMKDGTSCCFFRFAKGFGFITLGFDDPTQLTGDDGAPLVASAYRVTELSAAVEAALSAIVRKAAG